MSDMSNQEIDMEKSLAETTIERILLCTRQVQNLDEPHHNLKGSILAILLEYYRILAERRGYDLRHQDNQEEPTP